MHRTSGLVLAMVGVGVVVCATVLTAYSQEPGRPRQRMRQQAAGETFKSEVTIEVKDGFRLITSNGIPDHPTGQFPNRGNPNSISPQQYRYRVPVAPKIGDRLYDSRIFGIALNGVPFEPGTAELWNNDFRWHYEALSGFMASRGSLGMDDNLAHVQPNGAYHYHGLPMGYLKKRNYKSQMVLIGYAADGFPIYGPNAYTNPDDSRSPLKQLKSSYRIKPGMRPGGSDGPSGAYDGSFAQDYEFVAGLGDLDECNGRKGVTPEYPNGTYYYVVTDTWPFIPRHLKGIPDSSFARQGPGGGPGRPGGRPGFGGPGGPGGPGRPGGPPPFGGPDGPPPFGGPPRGMVPGDYLQQYLGLNNAQKEKLDLLMKAIDFLSRENFALPALARLELTDDQIRKIAAGGAVREILSAEQNEVLDANQRRGPGGFGGPGGPPPPPEE